MKSGRAGRAEKLGKWFEIRHVIPRDKGVKDKPSEQVPIQTAFVIQLGISRLQPTSRICLLPSRIEYR